MALPTVETIKANTAFTTDEKAVAAQRTLAWLEAGAPHEAGLTTAGMKFDMTEYRLVETCGTACCIAGAMSLFMGKRGTGGGGALEREWGIRDGRNDPLSRLFYGIGSFRFQGEIEPAEAAAVFRRYLETGVVDWRADAIAEVDAASPAGRL